MKKRIGILGSTGSIGTSALEVIRNLQKNGFDCEVVFLSCNNNIEKFKEQIDEFDPLTVILHNESRFQDLKDVGISPATEILTGFDTLNELVSRDNYDILINSLVGFVGLIPTLEAIKHDKRIALANKETLVVAGKLINETLLKSDSEIIPIDSEHSAIFQCLSGENRENISKIILTASGGPFRGYTERELSKVTVKQALQHPNWVMGNKITIDSATLMNKGLEVIEAKWLFNKDIKDIQVIIHPQSVIHSMVEFKDGSVKAQMGVPDMKVPIQYALTYPERYGNDFKKIDFLQTGNLEFAKPDFETFRCLKLAFDSIENGGTYPTVLNAANEVAVDLFLNGRIGFTDIPDLIEAELDNHVSVINYELQDLVKIDKLTRINVLNRNL
ncbi:MAG TPA: 1-deoxy-D-xylulose-5-phosphate reductoisomerase [Ignavibacteria bacterium]|nr:1-deoxy-D-xylulose-5-phosphate reductoisomerase [Ignavibacteria bacterium]